MDTSAPYKIKIIGRPPLHTYMKTKKTTNDRNNTNREKYISTKYQVNTLAPNEKHRRHLLGFLKQYRPPKLCLYRQTHEQTAASTAAQNNQDKALNKCFQTAANGRKSNSPNNVTLAKRMPQEWKPSLFESSKKAYLQLHLI